MQIEQSVWQKSFNLLTFWSWASARGVIGGAYPLGFSKKYVLGMITWFWGSFNGLLPLKNTQTFFHLTLEKFREDSRNFGTGEHNLQKLNCCQISQFLIFWGIKGL